MTKLIIIRPFLFLHVFNYLVGVVLFRYRQPPTLSKRRAVGFHNPFLQLTQSSTVFLLLSLKSSRYSIATTNHHPITGG